MKEITRLFDLLDLFRDEYSSVTSVFSTIEKGVWRSFSASEYVSISERLTLGLISLGVKSGTKIGTVMVNCPHWNFFDMAIMQSGAIQVPIYPTISEDNYRYILNDASVEYIIVSDKQIYDRIKKVLPDVPSLKSVFSIEKIRGIRNWDEILKAGERFTDTDQREIRKNSISKDDLVTIIYTSGTTGRPKGVMLSHNNFVTNFKALSRIPNLNPGDRAISFLPLCHVYERTASYCMQYMGISIYYIQTPEELMEALREVKPNVFTAVPRVMEKIFTAFMSKGRNLTSYKKVFFYWAVRQGHKYEAGKKGSWFYRIKLSLAYNLLLKRWRNALGGEIKLIVCGSASLHPRLSRIYWASRMPVLEAYGLTETSPGISMHTLEPGRVKFGTVGELLEDVKVKIAEDGEILVKGPGVMLGYYNRPDRTEEVFDTEGWFHTGDIGEFVNGKYLKITDRKKEMFKTSSGRYVAPQVIEKIFQQSPFIEHIMVIGENRKCTSALVVPDFQHLRAWCEIKHIHFISEAKAIANPVIIKRFQREINWYNADLGQTEKIKKFVLIPDEWSVASGEFSPTLKMRRKFIMEKYGDMINEMYKEA